MPTQHPVLGLWLDSVDYSLIRRWMGEGRLPHLQNLMSSGLRARLESLPHSRAEVMQSVAITAASPQVARYWGVHHYDPSTCRVTDGNIYDYRHRPPYFALGPDYKVAAIDFPQYNFHEDIHGWQVRNWCCHSAMTPTDSRPADLSRKLDEEFGIPPIRKHTSSTLKDTKDMLILIEDLHAGIDMRTRMIENLMTREPWDLFLTNYAEMHKGGHYLVPNPDSMAVLGKEDPWAPLRGLYEHMDRSIGHLMERFQDSWNLTIFSYEGIFDYSDEVQNTFLLADLLMRDSFRGHGAFVYEDPGRGLSPEMQTGVHNWVMESWHLRRRPNFFQKLTEKYLGSRRAAAWDAYLGLPPYPDHPARSVHCEYQPLMWLEKYWPHMRAFALPTFSDGFIRLNVRGREAQGLIKPSRFQEECTRLTTLLMELRDPTTNQPAVKTVIPMRDNPFQIGDERPAADLIVQWHALSEGNAFTSPTLGTFGPAPSLRSSTHSDEGFFAACGPDIPKVREELSGHILDIAPTLLDLMGAFPPIPLEGLSLRPSAQG
jgi:predicted AlkP superfamily phosphohydrolase/phosphomutase